MLDGSNPQAEANHFVDPDTNRRVNVGEAANFLNDYFCNISTRLGFDAQAPFNEDFKIDVDEAYSGVDAEFCLLSDPFVLDELEYCIDSIDISKSSSVLNISTFVCVDFMRAFPQHMLHIFNTSIRTGIFPTDWSKSYITVIPKCGKLSNLSNWRPITQTSIFAKILETLVHKRFLSYLDQNNIILTKFQYSIFDLVKFIHSGLNNKKLISCICLDVCKAFDCINHYILL